jgi:uncharacterized protein YciI
MQVSVTPPYGRFVLVPTEPDLDAGRRFRVPRKAEATADCVLGHSPRTLRAVADYYLVEEAKGPAWDHSRRRREQAGWDEHAAFMDRLAADGFVVLGGPIGDGEGENVLLVIDADDEATIRARLAEDPWLDDVLRIESIRPWSVWLRASASSA